MNVFMIVLITLIAYSTISTILFLIFDKEEIFYGFGLGIFGGLFISLTKLYHWLKNIYQKNCTYVLFTNKEGIMYKAKMKYFDKVWDFKDYKVVNTRVEKKNCKSVEDFNCENFDWKSFDGERIEKLKRKIAEKGKRD